MEHRIDLADPQATERLGQALAPRLGSGDVILLSGPIGAGKTHFARALIQSLLPEPEDIPSPTFTIVQIYDGPDCEIWHSDLYRLSHPDDAIELGLEDAFETEICLVEWPDRLGSMAPASALSITFEANGEGRSAIFSWTDPRWARVLAALHL